MASTCRICHREYLTNYMVNKLTFFWVFIISLVYFSAVGKRFVRCQLIISTFVLYAIWVYYHKKHLLICMWHSRVPTTRGCKCACVSMCVCKCVCVRTSNEYKPPDDFCGVAYMILGSEEKCRPYLCSPNGSYALSQHTQTHT